MYVKRMYTLMYACRVDYTRAYACQKRALFELSQERKKNTHTQLSGVSQNEECLARKRHTAVLYAQTCGYNAECEHSRSQRCTSLP